MVGSEKRRFASIQTLHSTKRYLKELSLAMVSIRCFHEDEWGLALIEIELGALRSAHIAISKAEVVSGGTSL